MNPPPLRNFCLFGHGLNPIMKFIDKKLFLKVLFCEEKVGKMGIPVKITTNKMLSPMINNLQSKCPCLFFRHGPFPPLRLTCVNSRGHNACVNSVSKDNYAVSYVRVNSPLSMKKCYVSVVYPDASSCGKG